MAPAIPTQADHPSVLLRFGGVEVDVARHRLLVDGREVRVQRLVFNLLLALSEAHGRVLSRDELFAKLWPDGVYPADESLSQLVFKLRNALGAYGGAIVTVRQVGLRLTAEVERVGTAVPLIQDFGENRAGAPRPDDDDAPIRQPAQLPESVPGSQAQAATTMRARWRPIATVCAAFALLALIVGLVMHHRAPVVLSAGFGLDADQVQASAPQTIETLARAFDADADGNQSAARVLMETAHAADPRTPVPAIFLTYWYGGIGEAGVAARWAAERDQRIGPDTPTYLALLARFLARDTAALERMKLGSLLLETEPGAALIRLAHAHHHLQRNEREAALEQLREVDLRAAGRRRAPIVLGDLASLGDLVTVEAALESAGDVLDAPGRAYAEARLRVSQGRFAEARAAFDRALLHAKSAERPDLVRNSAMHAAMMSAELGDFADARIRVERLIQALRDERAYVQAWDSTLVLATLPSVSPAEARGLLDRLVEDVPEGARSYLCLDVELVTALVRLEVPPALRCAAGRADEYARRGGSALAEGLHAQLADDPAGARTALARAESEGVRDTVLAPYADLLIARLSGSVQSAPVPDPPYPMWHRWALRWREAPERAR